MSLLESPFYTPFSESTAGASSEVPGKFQVALAGRGFNVDSDHGAFGGVGLFKRQSVPLLRTQADSSGRPGEASINPEDLWRRVGESWHKGGGQRNFDSADAESDPARFYRSQGIDPWTKGQIGLLPDTVTKASAFTPTMLLAVAGDYLYMAGGTFLHYTTDITASGFAPVTNVIGAPTTITSITSDGNTIYTAQGASGIYSSTRGTGTTASFATGTVTGVRYVKGRLFAWSGDKIYNVIAAGALPSVLLDHTNTDFTWVDVAEGPGFYYLAGFSGDKSLIYKTAVKPDGTGLDTPTVAAQLPDGEIVRSVYGYLGFVVIGTDKGIRFGEPDANGNIVLGGLIEDVPDVACFEGQGRFVWFGWSNFAPGVASGLGRMDLSAFNGTRPAYATDIMHTSTTTPGTGVVSSVVTFQGLRVFALLGSGFYAESPTALAPTGWLETGRISYGLYEPKVSMFVSVSHEPLDGSVAVALATDNGPYTGIGMGAVVTSTTTTVPTSQARAGTFDLRFTLTAGSLAGPVVSRYTLRSYPVASRSEQITVPLVIAAEQSDPNGTRFHRDINADLAFLRGLESTGRLFPYQEGSITDLVVMEDHNWVPHHITTDRSAFEGTFVALLKVFPQE